MSAPTISRADYFALFGINTSSGVFGLVTTRTEVGASSTNNLTWTWPVGMLNAFGSDLTWFSLTLQYSTVASNRPNVAVAYTVGADEFPPIDPRWTTIKSWDTYLDYVADNPVPANGAFTHPWPTAQPVAYRLILNLGKGTDPVIPPFLEMTWNIRLIVPVQTLNACQIGVAGCPPAFPGQTGTRLSWTAPDVSWWPGEFLQFISYKRCPCTTPDSVNADWTRITVDSSHFAAPTTYDVHKSTDGITYTLAVTNAALNQYNEWYDSHDGQSLPLWYYFVAHLPDTSTIQSNIIFAN